MLTIKISNDIEFQTADMPPLIMRRIQNDLTITAAGHGELKYFVSELGVTLLPRGYVGQLLQHLRDSQTRFLLQDDRLILPLVDFNCRFSIPEDQRAAADKLVTWRQGGIIAPGGYLKLKIMLEAMARIQQPALWITHTAQLVTRIVEAAGIVFGIRREEIGIIDRCSCTIGPRLTVADELKLNEMDLSAVVSRFGAVFVEDAFHPEARSFLNPISEFPALYRFWGSVRTDPEEWLCQMVFAVAGPIIHTIEQEEAPASI